MQKAKLVAQGPVATKEVGDINKKIKAEIKKLGIKEDKGFALKPWGAIRFGERKIVILEQIAIAMGNYFFKSKDQAVVKVEYTFGYKLRDNRLVIDLHHSSLPYSG